MIGQRPGQRPGRQGRDKPPALQGRKENNVSQQHYESGIAGPIRNMKPSASTMNVAHGTKALFSYAPSGLGVVWALFYQGVALRFDLMAPSGQTATITNSLDYLLHFGFAAPKLQLFKTLTQDKPIGSNLGPTYGAKSGLPLFGSDFIEKPRAYITPGALPFVLCAHCV